MTLFTDNPFEKMMIQKPDYGKREKSPPELSSPRCAGCPWVLSAVLNGRDISRRNVQLIR